MIFKMILSKKIMTVMFVLSVSMAAGAAEKSLWLFVGPYFSGDGVIYCKYVKKGNVMLRKGYPNCPAVIR